MRPPLAVLPFLPLALLSSCAASSPAAPTSPTSPTYAPVATSPATAHAALYADCLADAIAHQRYATATDADSTLLLFTCTGATARAFFDGLATWSAAIGSEFTHDGQTFRSTHPVERDLFGVDYCSVDACVITLNTGAFAR